MKKAIFLHDTETTGVEIEDKIIETAHALVVDGKLEDYKEELCKADLPIKPAAAMTHGYTNRMIADKPSFKKLESYKILKEKSQDGTYYVAHNAKFDLGMMEKEGIVWRKDRVIDTLMVAKHLYGDNEEVEMFKLQYFRYLFDFEPVEPKYMKKLGVDVIQPHTALSDILVLWIFLDKIMKDFELGLDELVELSAKPALEKCISFGNVFEKGVVTYEDAATSTYFQYGKTKNGYDYLDWAAKNMSHGVEREFSIKRALAYGLLNGDIPCISEMSEYINWGILFVYTKEEIAQALILLQKDKEYLDRLYTQYENKTNKILETEKEDQGIIDKNKFLLNYFVGFRKI
jgi:DNA polymerase III epsilon subunit-like protein